jgi:hypothetical protein
MVRLTRDVIMIRLALRPLAHHQSINRFECKHRDVMSCWENLNDTMCVGGSVVVTLSAFGSIAQQPYSHIPAALYI